MQFLDAAREGIANLLAHPAGKYLVEAFVLPGLAYLGIFSLILWPLLVLPCIATWRVLERGGYPGWVSLIPVYNWMALLRVARLSAWWLVLLAIPVVNVPVWIFCCIRTSRSFGRGRGFGWGLALLPPVFMTIVGASEAQGRRDELLGSAVTA